MPRCLSDQRCGYFEIDPEDEDEAVRIRELGSPCDIVISRPEGYPRGMWHIPPVCASPARLPLRSGYYGLILTGALETLLNQGNDLETIAAELDRITSAGGAVLLTVENPRFLLRNRKLRAVPALDVLERALMAGGHFESVEPLSLDNHLAGQRMLRGPLRLVRPLLRLIIRVVSDPAAKRLYVSPLNPVFALWIAK